MIFQDFINSGISLHLGDIPETVIRLISVDADYESKLLATRILALRPCKNL
jgi:hypothetical protein